MTAWRAICPKCRREVVFLSDERYGRCPDCGFTFELQPTQPARERAPVSSVVYDIFKTLLVVVLVMAGLTAVALGILFVGCATGLTHM